MKKKGLQQHNFTVYLTEQTEHLWFLVSGAYINSKVNRKHQVQRSQTHHQFQISMMLGMQLKPCRATQTQSSRNFRRWVFAFVFFVSRTPVAWVDQRRQNSGLSKMSTKSLDPTVRKRWETETIISEYKQSLITVFQQTAKKLLNR